MHDSVTMSPKKCEMNAILAAEAISMVDVCCKRQQELFPVSDVLSQVELRYDMTYFEERTPVPALIRTRTEGCFHLESPA